MTAFDRLDPALQHHIVNSLGWRALRPLQEEAIEPLLNGEHAVLLAPTAGGKTEAAIFPIVSRMLSDHWTGLSVLYICPIRALLNNLFERLERVLGLVGRRVGIWHGDIGETDRRRIRRDPPDLLLTTPESLEVMLVSRRVEHHTFFSRVKTVVVDEIHAFAGDDRGWHLLAVLERIERLAGKPFQRIGLSATVGNPHHLLSWLADRGEASGRVISPEDSSESTRHFEIDHVGTLQNAAIVISRLFRGEKRLVFVDSRARVEELAMELKRAGVDTFVSHSSLSAGERRDAERAFSEARDCVIVATSTLELGIDVGDLDRVIQVDAPPKVASVLQRLGRTGRRPGTRANCLFLCTNEASFLLASALVNLCERGFIEPLEPPALPYHILAQQIMALALQQQGIGTHTWWDWIHAMPGFKTMQPESRSQVLSHMLTQDILFADQQILFFGRTGEAQYGFRNFMELFSVFISPPEFTVLHGRTEIGEVHESSFLTSGEGPPTLILAGRCWEVTDIDWARKEAFVVPTEQKGRSRWLGAGGFLGYEVCQEIAAVLEGRDVTCHLSKRAEHMLEEARDHFPFVSTTKNVVTIEGKNVTWWTFGGDVVNAAIGTSLTNDKIDCNWDSFAIYATTKHVLRVTNAIQTLCDTENPALQIPRPTGRSIDLKFAECVPEHLQEETFQKLLDPYPTWQRIREKELEMVTLGPGS